MECVTRKWLPFVGSESMGDIGSDVEMMDEEAEYE